MSQPTAAPGTVYYKRNTFFTVLVYISLIGCIAGLIQSVFMLLSKGPVDMILHIATYLFVFMWDLQILKKKSFFFEGNLTKKCSPWLIVGVSRLVFGIVLIILGKIEALNHVIMGISLCVYFLLYRYWTFMRPWKQVQQMPVYMVQQPVMMTPQAPVVVHQPHMMASHAPVMVQQPPMMSPPQYVATQQYPTPSVYPKN